MEKFHCPTPHDLAKKHAAKNGYVPPSQMPKKIKGLHTNENMVNEAKEMERRDRERSGGVVIN